MRRIFSISFLIVIAWPFAASSQKECNCAVPKWDEGQCVAYVKKRVSNIPWSGNAGTWIDLARKHHWAEGDQPVKGGIAVFSGGGFGHVAYIESVNSDRSFTVSDCNFGSTPVPDTPGGKTFCCGFTDKRCVNGVGPRTNGVVTSAGYLGKFKLKGIIYPPSLSSPRNTFPTPVKTQPPVAKTQPKISYSVCINNIDDSGSVEVNGQTVLKVSKRGNQCVNVSLHPGNNPISFKVKNKKGDYSYRFAYRENGVVKWEKSCGDVNGKGCGKKMKKGGTLSMGFTAKL